MPQFHETGFGNRFFNGQLPALIHALERIATALEGKVSDEFVDKLTKEIEQAIEDKKRMC